MLDFFPGEDWSHVESRQISFQQIKHGVNILDFHRSQSFGSRFVGQVVFSNLVFGLAVFGEWTEANLVELRPFDCSMEIPAGTNWLWQNDPTCVNGLVDSFKVT